MIVDEYGNFLLSKPFIRQTRFPGRNASLQRHSRPVTTRNSILLSTRAAAHTEPKSSFLEQSVRALFAHSIVWLSTKVRGWRLSYDEHLPGVINHDRVPRSYSLTDRII
jgi:hypothetical protein